MFQKNDVNVTLIFHPLLTARKKLCISLSSEKREEKEKQNIDIDIITAAFQLQVSFKLTQRNDCKTKVFSWTILVVPNCHLIIALSHKILDILTYSSC